MKIKIIEIQSSLGGKVQLFPEKKIWNIGGQPLITVETFIKQSVEQALTFDPTIKLNITVLKLLKLDDAAFEIHISNGIHFSKSVIVAVGGVPNQVEATQRLTRQMSYMLFIGGKAART